MLEKKIESAVCDYAKTKGCLAEKFTSPSKRSVPDRIFTLPDGRMFFIEFKAAGKRTTPLQERDHDERRKRNVTVFVVDDIDEGKRIVDLMLGVATLPGWLR